MEEYYQLYRFVFNDNTITTSAQIAEYRLSMRAHLLTLYPELFTIKYNPQLETGYDAWYASLEETHGSVLSTVPYKEELATTSEKWLQMTQEQAISIFANLTEGVHRGILQSKSLFDNQLGDNSIFRILCNSVSKGKNGTLRTDIENLARIDLPPFTLAFIMRLFNNTALFSTRTIPFPELSSITRDRLFELMQNGERLDAAGQAVKTPNFEQFDSLPF